MPSNDMLLHRKWNLPGPSGRISSELMLPEAFDEENDHCALVILMHGFLGAKYKTPIPFLSEMLLAQGYAVLRFDFDGYGESEPLYLKGSLSAELRLFDDEKGYDGLIAYHVRQIRPCSVVRLSWSGPDLFRLPFFSLTGAKRTAVYEWVDE